MIVGRVAGVKTRNRMFMPADDQVIIYVLRQYLIFPFTSYVRMQLNEMPFIERDVLLHAL